MDNLTDTIYFIERIEINPYNDIKLYKMNYFEILQLLFDQDIHQSYDEIIEKEKIDALNFRFSVKKSFILKNDDVTKYFNKFNYRCDYNIIKNQTLIDINDINYYLINHFHDNFNYFITLVSINTKNLSKLYDNFKTCSDKENKLFISYLLTLMKYHFEENNNIRNNSSENSEISSQICNNSRNYIFQKAIDQPTFLKTELFLYQRVNLFWMQNKESENKKVILDESMIVNWGPKLEFNFETLSFQPKRNLNNYDPEKLNEFKGGCLCDDVGLGKTIQTYTHCLMNKSENLIIVPDHLLNHWISEYNKHINIDELSIKEMSNKSIVLTDFSNVTEAMLKKKWNRVIIDEYHEIINKDIYKKIQKINTEYKWIVTATPFVSVEIMHHILNFIGKNKIESKKIGKYKMYIEIYADLFRKNTKKSVEIEFKLPKIKESIYYLNFTEKEKLFYDTLNYENKKDTEQKQRYFCINPSLYLTENNLEESFVTLDLLDDHIKNMHQENLNKEVETLNKMKKTFMNNYINKELNDSEWENIIKNKFLTHPEYIKIDNQIKLIQKIKSTLTYFNNQIAEINKKKEKVIENNIEYVKVKMDQECGICMDELDNDFCLLQCGHMFCADCITYTLHSNIKKCPMCKSELNNTTIYTKVAKQHKNNDFVTLYGTKIANLINICSKINEKIVLFSYTPSLITNIINILNKEKQKTIIMTPENLKSFETDDNKIIVLSSDNNASGLNITCASTIIILEPLKEDYMYRRQIENQIIGRLHRIGQKNEINFIRLIIKDSIEQNIDKENQINDSLYNDKDDLRLETTKQTLEL